MKNENSNHKNQREIFLPRKLVPLVWAVIVLVIQILLPWVIAKIGPRLGWVQQNPAWWNLAGLVAVAIGLVSYIWCLVFHYRSYRAAVRIGFSPPHLVVEGPYRFSRNPMYVSGLFVWLGWTLFFGSPTLFLGFVLLWLVFTYRVIPHEERLLEKLFGDEYLAYKRSVGRWIGWR